MGKLLLLLVLVNIIVLTSCTETIVKKVTATATSNSDGGGSSATAVAKITTTKVSDTDNSEKGSTDMKTNNNDYDKYCPDALERVKSAIIKFSFQYLNELQYDTIYTYGAPLSVFFSICQLVPYTFGRTQKQLMKFCGVKSEEEVRCVFPIILSYNKNIPEGTEFYYSRITLSDYNNYFTKPFKRDMIELAGGIGINANSSQPKATMRLVNRVIAKQTNNKIRNVLTSSNTIKEDPTASKLVFISGVYFKSLYKYAFNTSNVTMRNYYDINNKVQKIKFTNQLGIFNFTYSHELDAQIISIPFVDNFFNCVLIIPKSKCGLKLKELANKIAYNPDLFKQELGNLKEEMVLYSSPFYANVSRTSDTVKILKQVANIDLIFNVETAEITNSYNKSINVYVGDGRQKTVVKYLKGGEYPLPNISEDSMKDRKVYTVLNDHPVIYVYENQFIPRIIGIAEPLFNDD